MGNDPDINELPRLERLCLEQAEECATPAAKTALRNLAADYRAASDGGRLFPDVVSVGMLQDVRYISTHERGGEVDAPENREPDC